MTCITVDIVRTRGALRGQHNEIIRMLSEASLDKAELIVLEMKEPGRFVDTTQCYVVTRSTNLSRFSRLKLRSLFVGEYWGAMMIEMDVPETIAHLIQNISGPIALSRNFTQYEYMAGCAECNSGERPMQWGAEPVLAHV